MDGRVVLITGATGGLGRVTARSFAEAGARLGLGGSDAGRLEDLAREAGLAAGSWAPAVGDLTGREGAQSAIDAVTARLGPIDVVLHLVGGWTGGTPVVDLDHDELRSMLDQHLWSTLHVSQAVVPGMIERGWGRIVAVSSVFAANPGPKGASYAVGKIAEETLLRSLAREVAGTGVTANVVVVKAIDTKHERETAPSPKTASWSTPEEIVAAMRYLCSDEAAAVNGARIPLDRGA